MKQMMKIGIYLLGLLIVSCNSQQRHGGEQQTLALPTLKVEQRNLESFNSYPTSIEGTQNIAIRAKVDGYISRVYVDEGEWVKKGTPLFKLETNALTQNAKAAKAAIVTAQLEVDKLIPLVQNKIVSKIQLATAKANLEAAKSNYQSIIANIGYTLIKSPVDGIVGSINFRKGTLVSPSTAQALTTVSNVNDVYAFFYLNEKELIALINETEGTTLEEKIAQFPKVRLKLADGSEYTHLGTIETIAGQVDKTTGTVKLRAKFSNAEKLLRNGNSGAVEIPHYYNNAITVPAVCTFELQGKRHVYVVGKDNQVNSKRLNSTTQVGQYIVVNGGLDKGSQILAQGLHKVYPGMTIQPTSISEQELLNSFKTTFK
ncbi:efflux RND transporter periplasmic adaptor subunit [Prolixibacteraceae bacterium JC049]|nr:efflux RND transporter periplasmic adaptor subunit [Prolixibacteraceae bacterium JC049]